MTDPLVQFVRDRLDEDEQVARSCIDEVGSDRVGDPFKDGSGICEQDDFPSYPWGSDERELAYMARFQPARVLADVEAKRRLVDDMADVVGGRYIDDGEPVLAEWVLLLLALPYADHPG